MQIINGILRFVGLLFLILFQVLVLNKLDVSPYIHPYVYPMFLILLPFSTPRWIMLPLAFLVGMTIDMFNNTAGMHAAACVMVAFSRPMLIKAFTPITGYESVNGPSLSELGPVWFALFTLTFILIHHTVYYFLHIFSISDFGYLALKIILSTLVSTLLIVIFGFLFAKRKVKR